MNYSSIKELAKLHKCRVTDLIALAPNNDPFYAGTPGDWAVGEWFSELWQRFGYGYGVHIRRVHYQIISQDTPVLMPNGLPEADEANERPGALYDSERDYLDQMTHYKRHQGKDEAQP